MDKRIRELPNLSLSEIIPLDDLDIEGFYVPVDCDDNLQSSLVSDKTFRVNLMSFFSTVIARSKDTFNQLFNDGLFNLDYESVSLKNKPSLANVATSGNYLDLTGREMPANTIIANNSQASANPNYVAIGVSQVYGRNSNSGDNLQALDVQEVIKSSATLIAGQYTHYDDLITTASFCSGLSSSTTGAITAIPIKWTANNGNMVFETGQPTDANRFGFEITL